MDETTDVTNLGQLALHLRLVKDGTVRSRFGTLIALADRKADTITGSVKEWCKTRGIDLQRAHVGSDGASTFVGRNQGVAAQLKKENPTMVGIHCVCHREALAARDACNAIPYLKNTVQPVLAGVYNHFKNSSVREAGLHSVQTLLNEPCMKLVEPKFVRWLSHEAAVKIFLETLPALILELEIEAEERKDLAARAYIDIKI